MDDPSATGRYLEATVPGDHVRTERPRQMDSAVAVRLQKTNQPETDGRYHLRGLPAQTEIALGFTGNPRFRDGGILHLACPRDSIRMEVNALLYPTNGPQPADAILRELKILRDVLKALRERSAISR